MLQQQPKHSIPGGVFVFIQQTRRDDVSESEDADGSLEDAALTERDYVRRRLKDELKREPTDQEVDEWLRQHTEGY